MKPHYPTNHPFYSINDGGGDRGHFKDYPVTPGVILTEVMAQIVVCLGIYLLREIFIKTLIFFA